MPLYDVTYKDRLVTVEGLEESDLFRQMQKRIHPTSWERIIKTVHDAVTSAKPSKTSQLIWTRTSALFGYGSRQPKRDVDHLWEKVIGAVGDGKPCLLAVGTLLRRDIAERPETWLALKCDTGDVDPDTDTDIYFSAYWIDDTYVPGRSYK